MAYTTIDDPSEYFNTVTYTGDGSADQDMTGVGFKPDFLWIKRRNAGERHLLTTAQMSVASGAYRWLDSASSHAVFSGGTGVASFDADGFTIKTSDATWNASGSTYVAWSWKANGGTITSNTDGDLRAATVQANQDAGFSSVYFLGGTTPYTAGHGLGVAPDVIISKRIGATVGWYVYHKDVGAGKYLTFSTAAITTSSTVAFTSEPTSSIFTGGTGVGGATDYYINYCFAEKQGYSKFGKYVGNGNANGAFVYTGFKPAFLLLKNITNAGHNWHLMDTKINPTGNLIRQNLAPSADGAEAAYDICDFLSNGFKFRGTNGAWNGNGESYIYMAFAENPFVTSTGIPTTAR